MRCRGSRSTSVQCGADPEQVYLKVVPTNDMNMTFGMSLTIFLLTHVLQLQGKGAVGYAKNS